ncbi:MAG: histidine triad nucleotide-binding protein [Planctomycetota bacterium]|nr:histidine triad nucleotide-binding protein [Planctomycetota bacterium]
MSNSECVFCRIGARKLHAMVVHEDDDLIAFRDINPQAPIHVLIIPKKHYPSLYDAHREDPGILGKLNAAALQIAEKERVASRGFRLVFNHGDEAGQTVHHVHLHLLGGRALRWPPG